LNSPHGQWRNIFLIEGVLTVAIAMCTYFVLPREPKKASFLNDREQLIASERIRVENAGLVCPNFRDYGVVELILFAE
jgi:predicted MFS family arabinose efflux permease